MKKLLACMIGIMMLVACVCGCAKPAAAPAPAEEAQEQPQESQPAAEAPAAEEAAADDKPYAGTTIRILTANQTCVEQVIYPHLAEFTELTGINVEMEIMGVDDYSNKAAIELAAQNSNLDLIFLRPLNEYKQYMLNGWLTDISEIGDDADFDLADYFPGALESVSTDGKLYGIPMVAESQIMYYRKDVFAEKGLEVPKTLEELRTVAEALQDPSNDFYGIFMRGKTNQLVTQFSSILYSFGGRFNNATESLLNTDAFKNATTYYGDLLSHCSPPGITNMSWTEGAALFAQGKLGIFIDSDAIFGNITNDENVAITADQIGFSVIPAGESGTPTPFYAVVGAWSVPTFSEKKGAALEFIKWAESKQMCTLMAKEVQNACCRASVWADADAMAAFDPAMLSAMLASREVAIGGDRPTVINVSESRDIISVPIQLAILGQDFTDAIAEAHAQFQALIDKENAG